MKIVIKNRFNDSVILCGEYDSIRDCLEKNIGATLSGANLSGANLRGANLYCANLRDANLSGANLSDATLNGNKIQKTPTQINNLTWEVVITEFKMKIGCEIHTHAEWKSFKKRDICKMESSAYEFWKLHKKALLLLCDIQSIER